MDDDEHYYKVQGNDCISSIAEEHGFFWQTLWDHANNQDLKTKRKDPNVLFEGDAVFIPDRTEKLMDGATEQRHKSRKKGVPAFVRFRLLDQGKPRANVRFILNVDGNLTDGQTDQDGKLEVPISPLAQAGTLTIIDGDNQVIHNLQLGALDPVTEPSGAVKRLQNLGLLGPNPDDTALERGLKTFQLQQQLEVTGKLDQATQDALRKAHGS
jgi:hypothetical protein